MDKVEVAKIVEYECRIIELSVKSDRDKKKDTEISYVSGVSSSGDQYTKPVLKALVAELRLQGFTARGGSPGFLRDGFFTVEYPNDRKRKYAFKARNWEEILASMEGIKQAESLEFIDNSINTVVRVICLILLLLSILLIISNLA